MNRIFQPRGRLALGFVLGAVLMSALVWAQTSTTDVVGYTGRLEQNGAPLSGEATLVFRLFDAEVGGNELDTFSRAVIVASGAFSTSLGPLSQATLDADTVYVQTEVNGVVLPQRQALLSSLNAVRATPNEQFSADSISAGTIDVGQLTAQSPDNDATTNIVEARSQNGTEGVALRQNSVTAVGTSANQNLNLVARGTGRVVRSCPTGMLNAGTFCIDALRRNESTYGGGMGVCAGEGKLQCSHREVCTAMIRGVIPSGNNGVSDLFFFPGNGRPYLGGTGAENSLIPPQNACSTLTPGPQAAPTNFRCCLY